MKRILLELTITVMLALLFSGIYALANATPLIGEEVVSTDAAVQVNQVRLKLMHTRNRLALQDMKLRKIRKQVEFLEKKLTETETETEPEPLVESHSDRAEFRIEPQTNVDDFNACYDELIRRGISECGGEPYLGMVAVYQVMYDRMYNMDAGYASIHDMLSVRNAFAAPYEGDISPWEPLISEACKAVFLNGERAFNVVTKYFYNPYYSSPEGLAFMESQAYVERIGDHIFCTEWKYVEGTNYDGVNPYVLPKEEI